jgi:hypothetical protein
VLSTPSPPLTNSQEDPRARHAHRPQHYHQPARLRQFGLVDQRETEASLKFCSVGFTLSTTGKTFDRAKWEQMMVGRKVAPYDTRHVINNMRVVSATDDEVVVHYIGVVHRLDHGTEVPSILVVDVDDRWVLEDGAWKVAERSLAVVFDGRPGARGR